MTDSAEVTRETLRKVMVQRDRYWRALMMAEHFLRERVCDLHEAECGCEVCRFIDGEESYDGGEGKRDV